MIDLVAEHAHPIIIATGIAFAGLLATLLWIVRHLERRVQHLEHEMAKLHVSLDLPMRPAAPEVARRYASMTA